MESSIFPKIVGFTCPSEIFDQNGVSFFLGGAGLGFLMEVPLAIPPRGRGAPGGGGGPPDGGGGGALEGVVEVLEEVEVVVVVEELLLEEE